MIPLNLVARWLPDQQALDWRDRRGVELPERLPTEGVIHVVALLLWLQLYVCEGYIRAGRVVAAGEVHGLNGVGPTYVLVVDP